MGKSDRQRRQKNIKIKKKRWWRLHVEASVDCQQTFSRGELNGAPSQKSGQSPALSARTLPHPGEGCAVCVPQAARGVGEVFTYSVKPAHHSTNGTHMMLSRKRQSDRDPASPHRTTQAARARKQVRVLTLFLLFLVLGYPKNPSGRAGKKK